MFASVVFGTTHVVLRASFFARASSACCMWKGGGDGYSRVCLFFSPSDVVLVRVFALITRALANVYLVQLIFISN